MYKRQDKVQTGAIKVAELRESLMDKINQLAAVRIEIERAIGTVPVSYTHLDVYKRQVQQDVAICAHDAGTAGK